MFFPIWRLMRPHTLTAAIMPVLIGTSLAYAGGLFSLPMFTAMMTASVLIQAAVNMFNEYFDYKRGLDSVESVGIGGVIVRDELHERTVFALASAFFLLSVILGLYICMRTSWWVAVIGVVSMAVGYFYSAGSHPIAYTPLGEAASGIFMGPVIVLISYFIQTGTITPASILISVPISIMVAAILMANNIRDAEGDSRKGRKTLAVQLGRDKAITFLNRMFMSGFIWTVALVLFKVASPWALLVFASVPKANKSIRLFKEGTSPIEMMPAMESTSELHSQYGILLSIGIVLGKFLVVK